MVRPSPKKNKVVKQDGIKSRFYLFLDDLKELTWKKWLPIVFVLIVLIIKLLEILGENGWV